MTVDPVCFKCKNYIRYKDGIYECRAFKIIPDVIIFGENDHSKPLKNQNNNIVFEER